jgi:feruloyl esterase
MTLAAKTIVENFFSVPPEHSYFTGSSTGGQQALMEAQRYPEDYDGILASAPAWDRVNLHLGFLWDWLAVNRGEGACSPKRMQKRS